MKEDKHGTLYNSMIPVIEQSEKGISTRERNQINGCRGGWRALAAKEHLETFDHDENILSINVVIKLL